MNINGKRVDIKDLVESKSVEWFTEHILGTLMESVDDTPPVLTPEDFSILELHEAVGSAQFPVVVGELISKKVIASYTLIAKIGDRLVTRFPSKVKIDKIPGFDRVNAVEEVGEGMPYPHTADIEEKYVTVEGTKFGEILDITEEAVMYDQTGQLLMEAAKIGEDAAFEREEHIIKTVTDQTGYKGWNPSGTATDLYANAGAAPHTYDNLITNILADYTDINAAYLAFAALKNKNAKPIHVVPTTLLVPVALRMTALRIMKNKVLPGAYNEEYNPVQGDCEVVSSAILDALSTVQWYIGDMRRQFIWKEVIPFEVLRRKNQRDSAAGFERDIIAQFKARWLGKCASLDYLYVIKSLGNA